LAVKIAIIDYETGNIHAVYKKLCLLDAKPFVTTKAGEILNADKIILPGVGCFDRASNNLKSLNIHDTLNKMVLIKKIPILGICLGMQLMANESEEGTTAGLGWIDTQVIKFRVQNKLKYKVPMAGWNTTNLLKESSLFKNIDGQSEFYFLHSYHYQKVDRSIILAQTVYEYEYVSAIEKENIFGTQFHPEKSHHPGTQLLKNFIQL
jgi:glutamine amidotransferase